MSIHRKLQNFLISKNHYCGKVLPCNNFLWCASYSCLNAKYCDEAYETQKNLVNFEKKLRKTHSCVTKNENTFPMSLSWCQKNACINKYEIFSFQYKQTPFILFQVKQFLEKYGHNCVEIPSQWSTDKRKFVWCQKENCTQKGFQYPSPSLIDNEKLKKINDESMKFAEKLINDGHTCVRYLETYPVQIRWCGNTVCTGNKY